MVKFTPIKGAGFRGDEPLTREHCSKLVIEPPNSPDSLTPNWLRKARGLLNLHLRSDNIEIDHISFSLHGNMYPGEKAFQTKTFWPTTQPLSLVINLFPYNFCSLSEHLPTQLV